MKIAAVGWPLFCAAGLVGCAHHQKGAGGTKPTLDGIAAACSTDDQCGSGQRCVSGTCIAGSEDLGTCTDVRVHFALDSSEIPDADRSALAHAASCLRSSHSSKVNIEGNADERGTEEYNLALGDRRAQSVAHYLEKLGATPDQIKTVSYGKDNPLCTEHDEDCWWRNRRAAIKPKEK
jgi:peptidoglycan-associated lipoprotein